MPALTEIARFTDNLPQMIAFYQHLLGAAPVVQSEGMAIFMSGGTKILLHQSYTPGEGELPLENHLAFSTADVDETSRQLEAAGLHVEVPARQYDWGYSAYLRDPDGQLIELIQIQTD